MTPDEFEKLTDDEKARAVAEHHDQKWYWGWCQRCHHKVEGKLADIRSRPCPACGFGGADPDIIHA